MRELYARRKVTIVNYHDPSPEVLDRHLAAFSRTYSFISIDQLARALEQSAFSELPQKAMLITFDDGHVGNARLLNTIRAYRVPAALYAVAGVVNTNSAFWFDLFPRGHAIADQLKAMPDADRRLILRQRFGYVDGKPGPTRVALSAAELRKWIAIGGTVGSHTMYHPLLAKCPAFVGRLECCMSRTVLKAMIERDVEHFALPHGSSDGRTKEWLREAGYRTARTTRPGWADARTDPLDLPTFGISDDAGVSKAIVQASGLWDLLKTVQRFRMQISSCGLAPRSIENNPLGWHHSEPSRSAGWPLSGSCRRC
jgi:peptidoglycan/xylan/chitin deacetylase (PgdA/CDA1 family)